MDLPDPGIELGSPALQADSLPTELSGKPEGDKKHFEYIHVSFCIGYMENSVH